ncbi:MAG: sodium-dependent transporter [Erysipelotrichales bacterium]|nr:sodium-dependent transporter [Erysipelotrichales bacterium]
MEQKRAQWGSRLGFILAATGSAVGLGNIWKFPGKAYEGGGGAYLILYVAIVLLIGMPCMLSELAIGRASQSNMVDSFKRLDHKEFTWTGWVGWVAAVVIACFYFHVGGWVLRYVYAYLAESKEVYADPLGFFYGVLGYDSVTGASRFPWETILFAFLFTAASAYIIIRGVKGGIEKFNKVGMPALFVLLIILLVRSVTLHGALEGVMYMLKPDFSKINGHTLLSALSQAFYSLSIGMSIMVTYGSYLPKEDDLEKNTLVVCVMDTLVAIIAGFIVIPAVFATLGSESVGKGGGFAFVSLAGVFREMSGGVIFGFLFYLLLLFAALSSCISIIESVVAFLTERFGWNRTKTTLVSCIILFLAGCLYTCSQAAFDIKGIWFDFVNGITHPAFCDAMEFVTDRLLIPLCSLGCCIFVGWVWKPESAVAEAERCGKKFRMAKAYSFLIKYVAPAAIIIILAVSLFTGTTLS